SIRETCSLLKFSEKTFRSFGLILQILEKFSTFLLSTYFMIHQMESIKWRMENGNGAYPKF
ncbi:MAG: hypothetical protein LCH44_04150, partial [Bacteroidetes bacterium]|nr:hypothetical protein [Bacteroidota bacterium]